MKNVIESVVESQTPSRRNNSVSEKSARRLDVTCSADLCAELYKRPDAFIDHEVEGWIGHGRMASVR
jgi:hypothetical protein